MDIIDRKLLNTIQTEFPLVDEHYAQIAKELDISENELLERLTELKQQISSLEVAISRLKNSDKTENIYY